MSAAGETRGGSVDGDRTARARIRDVALRRFAADGVAATSLKAIAADAGVSAPLILHHFGSKEGLRRACDEHVANLIKDNKRSAISSGFDPLQALRTSMDGPPVMRYLARTLADGSPQVAALVDDLVADAVEYMAEGVEAGLLKPSADPYARAAILTLWQLGALVLHEHAERLVGADLLTPDQGVLRWMMPAAEILTNGVIEERFHDRLTKAADDLREELENRKEAR